MARPASLADLRRWRRIERGELPSPPAGAPSVALVYPNAYSVGMSSLGCQATLALMRREGLGAERFFAFAPLQSVDAGRSIHRFSVVAFSVSFELDWLHVLQFLQAAKIPLRADQRQAHHPLILAGGLCVSLNRAPAWPFIDVFVHGEAEAVVPPLAAVLRRHGLGRAELLAHLGAIPGVEITAGCARAYGLIQTGASGLREGDESMALPSPPEAAILADLDEEPCVTRIFTPETEFADMALIGLARGCPRRCSFCWIGHNAPPYRVASRQSVVWMAEWAMRFTDRIGLVASAVGAHPEIDAICADLGARGAKISFSSLRAEEVTPAMLQALAASGQKSITLAPEAGSQRLRRLLGKPLSDERILEIVEWALAHGILSIKLYFMTGLPTETEDEADEIVRFTQRARSCMTAGGKKSGAIGSLTVNLGLFTPKPNVPLLRLPEAAQLDFGAISKRLKRLVRALRRIPNTRVMASSPELNGAQGILSVGGLEAADFLLEALAMGGDWRQAFRRRRAAGGGQ